MKNLWSRAASLPRTLSCALPDAWPIARPGTPTGQMACACACAAALIGWNPLVQADAQAGEELGIETELVGWFASPLYVTHAPNDFDRIFVIERAGRVMVVENGVKSDDPFLDITSIVATTFEGGLLGIAFHPNYESNGHFFVHYTRPGLVSVVERYTVTGDPDIADPNSGHQVLELNQPAANHNAGWIDFGPNDGYLYVPFGDGGPSSSVAQDITNQWLGKILRIDIDGDDFPADTDRNYAIPQDNPFVGAEGDDEIWALGLRNPWRCGFDRQTGDLYIGDVGQSAREEVDVQDRDSAGGENYGWGCMEGSLCMGSACVCNDPDLTLPVFEYTHDDGCAITGGTVYRGCAIPELDGTYFTADFCSAKYWSFKYVDGAATELMEITGELNVGTPTSFGQDAWGEIYITSSSGGVSKIVSTTPPADKNENGIPDSCENDPTPGDLNGDGAVDVTDLLELLAAWGPCVGCSADLDGNGAVDVTDLLTLLGNWG